MYQIFREGELPLPQAFRSETPAARRESAILAVVGTRVCVGRVG